MQRIMRLGTLEQMQSQAGFDVLVIGSGASGLAAAVAADRAGAQGRARDQGLDPGEQLVEGTGRDPGLLRRRRLARAARRGRDALVARDRGSAARRAADGRRAGRDSLARGARLLVHARERRLPPRALRRRLAQAAAPGRRPHRARDHEGAPRGPRGGLRPRASRTTRSRPSSRPARAGAHRST